MVMKFNREDFVFSLAQKCLDQHIALWVFYFYSHDKYFCNTKVMLYICLREQYANSPKCNDFLQQPPEIRSYLIAVLRKPKKSINLMQPWFKYD